MKNDLGECSWKITCQNGEHSEILVSNPVKVKYRTLLHGISIKILLQCEKVV